MKLVQIGQNINGMDFTAQQKELPFDLKTCAGYVQDYALATGVECSVIDLQGTVRYSTSSDNMNCTVCKKLQKILGEQFSCSSVYLYGSYQAERLGGKDIFFCPVGFAHWAAPVIIDGIMQGSLIGGPVVLSEYEFFINDTFLPKYDLTPEQMSEVHSLVRQIRYIHPSRVSSLAEILSLVSRQVVSNRGASQDELQDQSDDQAKISENIYLFTSMGGEEDTDASYPLEKERELLGMIASGDKAGARKTLNEILGHVFFASEGNFEIIKARILELVVLLSRAALEGGAEIDEIFGMNFGYLNQIHAFSTVEQLAAWLSRIMNRFSDCVFNLTDVKHVDVIYKTLDYVKKNYMNKITLADVAGNAHISPSYFSKIFKDEMNCNFNMYLNQVRIQNSKKLLLDDSISLVDVAFLCGFEDQSYFSKVFKKIAGLSPGKYRESMGRKKQDATG